MAVLPALPSLHALLCFDATARLGSVTGAARSMHLTHGAVSRQIRLLEEELGRPLFVREHRRVVLTKAGARLARATEEAFEVLRAGAASVKRREDMPIVVSCEPTLALRWLLPRLPRLFAKHPEMTVHVESRGGEVDFTGARVDVAIRRADFDWGPEVASVPLFDEWLGPVTAPAYAKRLRARSRVTHLHTKTRPGAWAEWARTSGRPLRRARDLTFDHFGLAIEAAIAGVGVAIGPLPLVAEELSSGRLVAPFGLVRGTAGYHVLVAKGDDRRDVAAVRAWLLGEGKAVAAPRPWRAALDPRA